MADIQSKTTTTESSERGPIAMQLRDGAVTFHGRTAVRECTFDVTKNRVTSLIGPSRSGKTTLLRAQSSPRSHAGRQGDRSDSSRRCHVYRGNLTATELRTRVGMVFQRPNPFPTRSIYDNAISGLRFNGIKKRTLLDEAAETSLRSAALWDSVLSRLKVAASNLSGGEQQRLCIARVGPRPRGPVDGRTNVRPGPGRDAAHLRAHDESEEPRHRHHCHA